MQETDCGPIHATDPRPITRIKLGFSQIWWLWCYIVVHIHRLANKRDIDGPISVSRPSKTNCNLRDGAHWAAHARGSNQLGFSQTYDSQHLQSHCLSLILFSLELLLKNSLDPCYAMHLIRHVRIVGRLPTCKVSFHIFVIQILHWIKSWSLLLGLSHLKHRPILCI